MQRTFVLVGVAAVAAFAIIAGQRDINVWIQQALLLAAAGIERVSPRGGRVPAEPPPELEPAPQPLWAFSSGVLPPNLLPVIDDAGRVFVTTAKDLVVLDPRGAEIRRTPIIESKDAFAGAARRLADGRLILPVLGGLVVFAPDGTRTSVLPLGSATQRARAPIETTDGGLVTTIYESNAFGARSLLLSLDPVNGAERWRFDAAQHRVDWIVPASDGRLYVSIEGSRWEFDREGHRSAAHGAYRAAGIALMIAGTGELLHLPSADGPVASTLAELGVTRGAAACRPVHVTLSRDGQTAYYTCNNTIHAVAPDGSERWSRSVKWIAPYPLTPAPDGGIYAVVDYGLQAFGADGSSRFRVWLWKKVRYPGASRPVTPVEISTPPRVAPDGTIYVGTKDNGVYAIAPDGQIRWRYGFAGHEGSPPYVTDLAFLEGALLVSASGLTALPAPSALLQPVTGTDYYDPRD